MNTNELLEALGWPDKHKGSKGSLVWQKHSKLSTELPATASLRVSDKIVKANVLNLVASQSVKPHLQVEWDITGLQPVLKKCTSNGTDLFSSYPTRLVEERAIQDFCSAVALLNTYPLIDLTGFRNSPTFSELPDLTSGT